MAGPPAGRAAEEQRRPSARPEHAPDRPTAQDRSDKGNEAKGTHSKSWAYVPSAAMHDDVLHGDEGIGGTAEQQACFTEGALAAMGESVAIGVGPAKGTDYLIALQSPNTADGKGIDHLFPVLVGVAESCGYVLDF